jgi:cellulase
MATNGMMDSGIEDLTTPSIQRPYYWYPIEDPLSSNMSCNYNGISNAPDFHANIPAGGNITAVYATVDTSIFPYQLSWRHSHGPMLVYLARCPGDSCANFDPTGAIWFKISQTGLTPDATDMTVGEAWYQAYLNGWGTHQGGWTVQIPEGLKKGAYLIRHEIIMLAANPAQFYPNCAQIMVTGDGEKQPKSEELVPFPGAYKSSGEFGGDESMWKRYR